MSKLRSATAVAHPNIALVKYWGKRDETLNLPAAPSLSITLDTLATRTTVQFSDAFGTDSLSLDGAERAGELSRVSACLDLLRLRAGTDARARIESTNNFPTAAGLASSASGFAALVTAADAALGLGLSTTERSALARRGSGSAARSIYGGFVEMAVGQRADGADSAARAVADPSALPLSVVIAITSETRKPVGSTEGMTLTARTSPYYPAWTQTTRDDVDIARRAVLAGDFDALAAVSEASCLKMHGLAMSALPGLVYLRGATVEAMHCVRDLRASGTPVFFTVDAGPQVKAICTPGAANAVAATLAQVPGVLRTLTCSLGGGARVDPAP